jgi:hypothetical protein
VKIAAKVGMLTSSEEMEKPSLRQAQRSAILREHLVRGLRD